MKYGKRLLKTSNILKSKHFKEGNGSDRGSNFQKPVAKSRIYATMDNLDYETACYGESVGYDYNEWN